VADLGNSIDDLSMRRRLRFALLIIFICALGYMWRHALPMTLQWEERYLSYVPRTQAMFDADLRRCLAAVPADSHAVLDDVWGMGPGVDFVGKPGACHRADAFHENTQYRAELLATAIAEFTRPRFHVLILVLVTALAWLAIPLALKLRFGKAQAQPAS
jgi:hypothetical protein